VPANQLVAANSFANLTTSLAMMVGPLLAGLTVEQAGVPAAFLFDAFTFLFSGLSIKLLAPQPPERRTGRGYLEELGEGLLFFRRFTVLLWFQAMAAVSNLGFYSATALSAPFARDVLQTDAAGYGMLYTSGGVGMLVGSLIAPLFRRFPMYRVMTLSNLLGGVALTGLALTRVLPHSMAVLAGFGGATAVWNAFSATLYQRAVPDRLQGRVQSFRTLVSQGTMPIGYALAGVMADRVGMVPTLLFVGASIVVFGSVSFAMPSVARLDQVVRAAAEYAEASPTESARVRT
jgi:MFS family permease